MEFQFFAATDELHVSTRLVQQSRQIERGSSATDDHDAAPSKRLNLAMASAMGKEFRGQVRQVLRNIFEVSDPDRKHHPAGLECLSIIESQLESAGHTIDADHELVFKLRHHAVSKGKPVCAEGIDVHRHTRVGIVDALFRAKLP